MFNMAYTAPERRGFMPLIVDHNAVKTEILMALQSCLETKPLTNITLREIAKQAGMPHSKLMYYFKNKKDLIMSYVRYTSDYFSIKCVEWFTENPRENYSSSWLYMSAFMEYVATGKAGESRPDGTTQTYVLACYDPDVAKLVQDEFWSWKATMTDCLKAIYGQQAGEKEAEAMMILISGTFICNYNRALTGEINSDIIGYIANLTKA